MTGTPAAGRPGERGQASVELLALAPVVVAAAMAVLALLAAGRAREIAATAAQAGAMALLQASDARDAARDVVPPSHRPDLEIMVTGRSVTVRVRPRVPLFASPLTASSTAHAGARP